MRHKSTKIVGLDTKKYDVHKPVMSPEQCRAARGWLDWSQQELAARAKVSLSTVRDFEKRRRNPIANNRQAMRSVLEAAGIEFTNGDIPGVRRKPSKRSRSR
jgi:DNA-binding transcriptional regulator YiaG